MANKENETMMDCSLGCLSPGVSHYARRLPAVDVVPAYAVPDALTRHVRSVALLLGTKAEKEVREVCADFLKQMPVLRRQKHAAQQHAAQQHEDKILQLRMASPKNNKI
jgi:hypothetical protein